MFMGFLIDVVLLICEDATSLKLDRRRLSYEDILDGEEYKDKFGFLFKNECIYFHSENPRDLYLFLNGALWALTLVDKIKSHRETKVNRGKWFVAVDAQQLSQMRDIPLFILPKLKNSPSGAGHVFEPHDDIPLMVEDIRETLQHSSETPWRLFLEGIDHLSGDTYIESADGVQMYLGSDNSLDMVYVLKIKSCLYLLISIYDELNHQ